MRVTLIAVLISAFVMTTNASAVQRSPTGHGEALLFPYFGVLGGNNTLLTISSREEDPKALKVNFINPEGETVTSFNLYLESLGSWTAALSLVDGQTTLATNDNSCTIPALSSDELAGLSSVRSGFIEVIEMGSFNGIPSDLYDSINQQNCEFLERRWVEGSWADDPSADVSIPEGEMSGAASIINVEKGTQYHIPAVALINFSVAAQHSAGDEPQPNLGSANDGTDDESYAGTLCDRAGCETALWRRPEEAVAYALNTHGLAADFSTESEINAQAEVIFTFPMRRFFEELPVAIYQSREMWLEVLDRDGKGDRLSLGCFPLLSLRPCGAPYRFEFDRDVNVSVFGRSVDEFGSDLTSPILGETSRVHFPSPDYPNIPDAGRANFYTGIVIRSDPRSLNSVLSSNVGWPVLATILVEYANGQLTDGEGNRVRANYGSSNELFRTVR